MKHTDRTPKPSPAEPENIHPSVKIYIPRLDEFEEALALARKRYDELPDWLKVSMGSHRLRK